MGTLYLLFRCFFLGYLLSLLAACADPGAPGLWQDYAERLARLARQEAPAPRPAQRPRWPDRRLLLAELPEWRTGLLGWLELLDCDLMELVASRNSVLGRVQVPAARLRYEHAFLTRGEACLATHADLDPELRSWLSQLLEEKRAALPALYHNTTLAGRELQNLLATGPIPAAPPLWPAANETLQMLAVQARLMEALNRGEPTAPDRRLEAALEFIDKTRAGQVLDAMALAEVELERSTALLRSVDTGALCPRGQPSQRARYFRNVLNRIYATRIQPWLSDVWRQSEALETALVRLARAGQPTPALQAWLAQTGTEAGLRARLQSAMQAHTQAWQSLLGDCGLMPDGPIAGAPDGTRPQSE